MHLSLSFSLFICCFLCLFLSLPPCLSRFLWLFPRLLDHWGKGGIRVSGVLCIPRGQLGISHSLERHLNMKLPLANIDCSSQRNLSICSLCWQSLPRDFQQEVRREKNKETKATMERENPIYQNDIWRSQWLLLVFADTKHRAKHGTLFTARCWVGIGLLLLVRFWRRKQELAQCYWCCGMQTTGLKPILCKQTITGYFT